LTLIEEHGATFRLSESELAKIYRRANDFLKDTQDAEDKERLRACALIVIKRLLGVQLHDKNFTLYGAVQELESRLIEQALELEEGNITRTARRLGLKRQTLSQMLQARHKKLFSKRTPPEKRLRSIIKEPKG
jgi:DNA-binding NtrC family response regulator